MRQEVRLALKLEPEEEVLLDNHSLLNLFNILEARLETVRSRIKGFRLKEFSSFCLESLMGLNQESFREQLPAIENRCAALRERMLEMRRKNPGEEQLLDSVLLIIQVGHARILEMKGDRHAWQQLPRDQFLDNLTLFLEAARSVSDNRFSYGYGPGLKEKPDYRIEFQIHTDELHLRAPLVLHDTIRDLVGNSRKYSPPGSLIRIDLAPEAKNGLRLKVRDTGWGIPEEELEKVVQFGYRATNVLDRRTMGGGFGLTKAYCLARKYGGQFFIESEVGKGTSVELTLFDATVCSGIP